MAIGYMNLLKIPFESAKPLLDEMMTCVQIMPSSNVKRKLIEEDIEEVSTRLKLRKEIWDLHISFFLEEKQSTSESNPQVNPQENSLSIKPQRKR